MRVSMSAMGSVMLIGSSSCSSSSCLPARLDDARYLAAHGIFAKLVAAQSELAEHATRPSGERAAIAKPRRIRVARQLLQLQARGEANFVRHFGILDDRNQRLAPLRVLRDELLAFVLPIDQCKLGHADPQPRNGNLNAASSAFASASLLAVVVIEMFIPRIASILSYPISGKMICSLTPML